jgi:hypothetical protein
MAHGQSPCLWTAHLRPLLSSSSAVPRAPVGAPCIRGKKEASLVGGVALFLADKDANAASDGHALRYLARESGAVLGRPKRGDADKLRSFSLAGNHRQIVSGFIRHWFPLLAVGYFGEV